MKLFYFLLASFALTAQVLLVSCGDDGQKDTPETPEKPAVEQAQANTDIFKDLNGFKRAGKINVNTETAKLSNKNFAPFVFGNDFEALAIGFGLNPDKSRSINIILKPAKDISIKNQTIHALIWDHKTKKMIWQKMFNVTHAGVNLKAGEFVIGSMKIPTKALNEAKAADIKVCALTYYPTGPKSKPAIIKGGVFDGKPNFFIGI